MKKWHSFYQIFAFPLLLVLTTSIAYVGSFSHQFVWDDLPLITENSQLRELKNIPSFFLPHYWKYDHPGTKGQYRPLRAVTMALSYHFWKLRPFGYHVTNLILHIFNALLVYLVITTLFGKGRVAVVTSLLFTLHPIHTESISWLKNRTDLLALIFFQLSLLGYLKFIRIHESAEDKVKAPLWLTFSSLCFILSLMGKETAIIFPLLLVSYLLYFHPYPANKGLFTTVVPFCGITIFYLVFCFIIINKGLPPDPDEIRIPFQVHLFLIIQTISSYVSLIFLPINLNAERLMDISATLASPSLLFSISLILLIACIQVKFFLPPQKEGFAITWFFITLLPVINLKFMSGRPLAEQRLYIPSVGFCLLVSLVLTRLSASLRLRSSHYLFSRIGSWLTVLLVGCYAFLTWERDKIWHNNLTLWKDTVAKSPQTFRSHFNLGSALTDTGDYGNAIAEFEKSIKLNPTDHESFTSLGATYYRKGDMEKAKESFLKAIEMFSNSYRAHNNLGNVYTTQGEAERAIKEYQEAIKIKPDFAEAHYNMGNAYKAIGDVREAIPAFTRAIELEPDFPQSYFSLGNCYLLTGEKEKAQREFAKAVEIEPTFVNARYNLGNLFYEQKAYRQAIQEFQAILMLDPQHPEAHYILGSIFSEIGKLQDALREYREVIRISPNHAAARNSLGKVYLQTGQIDKGKEELKKALELDPQNAYAHYNLGKALVTQGDSHAASEEFQKALDLNPRMGEAWYNLSVILHKQGNDAAAIANLLKAVAANADYFDAHYHLGNLYTKQKQFALAVSSFEEAARIKPENAETHLKLGIIYLDNLNNRPKALHHLREVLRLDPRNAHAAYIQEALTLLQ